VVALDECFVDLTTHHGSSDLVAHYPNLVLIKAHTKTFSLAGLRVGYALCSDAGLLGRMTSVGQPWAVSAPAQLAGAACARTGDYLGRSRRLIASERDRLLRALAGAGLSPLSGEANYLLFEGSLGLREKLLEQGILVRSCDNYRGLDGHWYRIAVRTPHENDRLISALREVCP
ncbi:MAG: aminotransferase class I/II-fold pyridoxal phosphate-dependent enzyme, partial [Atopobiaceae bacterium]|nr:aminotransferase class I/II-fold pyridoxal phosphate-dependent enzyme [Atopobiaceae bacterium]